jgi:hypothetical protein
VANFLYTTLVLLLVLECFRRGRRANRRITNMAKQIDDELARIDAYTTELADDIDRLAAQVSSGEDPAAIAAALKARADALRLVADKSQPDVVPPAPDPLA